MKIGMIGAGRIGSTLAGLLARAGHDVALSNSRAPETLGTLVRELGGRVSAVRPDEAARFGEVVIEAIPFGRYRELPREALRGKTLVSASNYYPQRDGKIELGGRAATELIAEHLSDSTVVKAFNTIHWLHLRDQGDASKPLDERRAIFLSGDDRAAKEQVAGLIAEIGFGPFDLGSLRGSRLQEPDSVIYNRDMTVAEARALLGFG